jgi:hypothetical protein
MAFAFAFATISLNCERFNGDSSAVTESTDVVSYSYMWWPFLARPILHLAEGLSDTTDWW